MQKFFNSKFNKRKIDNFFYVSPRVIDKINWWIDRYVLVFSRNFQVCGSVPERTNLSYLERRAEALLWEVRIHQSKPACKRIARPPLGMPTNNPPSHSRPILVHSSTSWLRVSLLRTDVGSRGNLSIQQKLELCTKDVIWVFWLYNSLFSRYL